MSYDEWMSRSYVWVRARMRWIRFAFFGASLLGIGILVTRFTVVSLASDDGSCMPIYQEKSAFLVDTWGPERIRLDSLVGLRFRGQSNHRVLKVLAVAGERLALRRDRRGEAEILEILRGEEPTGIFLRPSDEAELVEGVVPQGHVFAVNLARTSEEADSRSIGWIPLDSVLGRVVAQLPW